MPDTVVEHTEDDLVAVDRRVARLIQVLIRQRFWHPPEIGVGF